MKNKTIAFIIPEIFLIYFGLKDLTHFNLLYNGIAVIFGLLAIVLGIIEYTKNKK